MPTSVKLCTFFSKDTAQLGISGLQRLIRLSQMVNQPGLQQGRCWTVVEISFTDPKIICSSQCTMQWRSSAYGLYPTVQLELR